jgi:drug/metabolite transporter (DMT)-like permease
MISIRLQKFLPVLALLLAMILWASSFIALKIAFRTYDPMVVIFGRLLVATLCFIVFGRRLYRSLVYRPGDYKLLLFMAFCEPCLYFVFEAMAVENTSAAQAGMMTAMLPILVMAAAALILKEKVNRRAWVGGGLAVFGVCWLTLASVSTADAPDPVLGNFYEFLAMVCATGYIIVLKHLTTRYSPFFLTAVQAVVGCLFYLPLLFLPGTNLPGTFDMVSTFAVLYLGAVVTLGAYGLYNYAIKLVPASQATLYVNLIPVFTAVMSWMILDETFTLVQCTAAGVVMAGVYLGQSAQQG